MSAHGYIPSLKKHFLDLVKAGAKPAVLEVGVDRGTMLVPLAVFLSRICKEYLIMGIDVLVQEQTSLLFKNIDVPFAYLMQGNSLDVLPKLIEQKIRFDVILLDGDHNYYTVRQELEHIDKLLNPGGIVIVDDYSGKWAERDLFYSEREGYESVECATKKVETEKHGVKAAVDEYLFAHGNWGMSQPIQGEPVLLVRNGDVR